MFSILLFKNEVLKNFDFGMKLQLLASLREHNCFF